MNNLEYSMVDVMLTILKYSKGRWTSDEVLEFAYLLEGFHEEELGEPKPTLVSIKGGVITRAEQDQEPTE
jgi:hypothetical protein